MGLPNTLAGLFGIVAFMAFILGLMALQGISSDSQSLQNKVDTFQSNLNASVNGSTSNNTSSGFWGFLGEATGVNGVYDFILGFFSIIVSFIDMIYAFLASFLGIIGSTPIEFYFIFIIFSISILVGIVKLIFLSGD